MVFGKNRKIALQQALYQQHYSRIYNTCLRIVGDPMDAEEVMHDVFLKLFDRIDQLQNEKAFLTWSKNIAVSTSIDRMRKRKIIFEQVDENLSVADEEDDNEALELSVEIIKQEMNKLPDGYRIILSMRLFEEYEFDEIAQVLQIRASTVRSQFVRGRDKLAKALKGLRL